MSFLNLYGTVRTQSSLLGRECMNTNINSKARPACGCKVEEAKQNQQAKLVECSVRIIVKQIPCTGVVSQATAKNPRDDALMILFSIKQDNEAHRHLHDRVQHITNAGMLFKTSIRHTSTHCIIYSSKYRPYKCCLTMLKGADNDSDSNFCTVHIHCSNWNASQKKKRCRPFTRLSCCDKSRVQLLLTSLRQGKSKTDQEEPRHWLNADPPPSIAALFQIAFRRSVDASLSNAPISQCLYIMQKIQHAILFHGSCSVTAKPAKHRVLLSWGKYFIPSIPCTKTACLPLWSQGTLPAPRISMRQWWKSHKAPANGNPKL